MVFTSLLRGVTKFALPFLTRGAFWLGLYTVGPIAAVNAVGVNSLVAVGVITHLSVLDICLSLLI